MLLRLIADLFRRDPAAGGNSTLQPQSGLEQLLKQAQEKESAGKADDAIALCRSALTVDPVNASAHRMLARLSMPGEYYRDVLRRIHEHLRPRTYLEIGVSKGDTISLVHPETAAIGLDPQPKIDRPLSARTRIFTETSDDFFAHHDVAAELGGLPIDLAMIDGMHHFEFALRDFINVERCCAPASTILIHDCYPLDEISARRTRVSQFWSGDVWKVIVCLKKYRPDLTINTVACAPTGLAVIQKLDPTSIVLPSRLKEICDEFIGLPFSTIENRKAEVLNVYPNDWEQVRALLSA
jgi:hypothetical protein